MTKKKAVRKTTKRTTRKAGHKRPVPGWIILLSGVLSGLLLAVFIYVKGWVPEPIQNTQQPVPGVAQEAVKPVEDVSKSLTKQKPDYDFYSVLPEMEVVIPKEELAQQAARNSKEYTYILQVASYKTLADAEALKAQIAFSGQIAYIESIDVNGAQWFRVRVGPFDSSREADKQKRQLESSGHKPLVLKQNKT